MQQQAWLDMTLLVAVLVVLPVRLLALVPVLSTLFLFLPPTSSSTEKAEAPFALVIIGEGMRITSAW